MAFGLEELKGAGLTEELAAGVIKLYEQETTGLRGKNTEVIAKMNEYKTANEKLAQDYEAERAVTTKQIEDLNKQIKAAGGEELKNLHEAEKKQLQDQFAVKVADYENKVKAGQETYNQLYGDYVKVLKNTELDQAMDKLNNLDPSMRSILRDVFWARFKFEFKSVEQGAEKKLYGDDYKTIGDTLTAFIGTEEGKRFQLANSTGGGATGSSNVKPIIGNPFIKGKENLTEQGVLLKTNPTLYNTLKAQAEALSKGA